MARYLEIPEVDIVYSQSLASEQNPQDTAIALHTRTDLRQTQAQFLQGEIMAGTHVISAAALRQVMAPAMSCDWWCTFACYVSGGHCILTNPQPDEDSL